MSEMVNELVDAAEGGDVQRIRELIDAGVDINARNQYGEIALIKATLEEYSDVVRLLIENGVNVNAQSEEQSEFDIVGGETALYWASGNENAEIIRLLLDAGANITLKNNNDVGPTNFPFFNNIYSERVANAAAPLKRKSKRKKKYKKRKPKSKSKNKPKNKPKNKSKNKSKKKSKKVIIETKSRKKIKSK